GLKTLDALPPMHTLVNGDDPEALSLEKASTEQNPPPALDETPESVQDAPPQQDENTSAASADHHAETALTQPLSFADLEARLAARAKRQHEHASTQTNDVRSDDHESE
ncbi:MAG: SMC-Scp complex subunit ScpB, partial [Pseudomonadota bacterium]|nr:SMC-Scp complex subunit ScpB [Pseudomonadota bacterium]